MNKTLIVHPRHFPQKDALTLLQPLENRVTKTTEKQMSRVIIAMISMTGRVTMSGLSRCRAGLN